MIFVGLMEGCDSGSVSVIHYAGPVLLFNNDHFVFSSHHDLSAQRRGTRTRSGVNPSAFACAPMECHQRLVSYLQVQVQLTCLV